MKLKTTLLAIFFIAVAFSCSSDDSSTTTTTGGTITVTNTWVKLTAINANGDAKPNYIIMMFDAPLVINQPLPPILKQVTTDANGLGYFDLNTMITSTTKQTYYFEAFFETENGYALRSISHPEIDLKKGSMSTTSIIVN